MSPRTRLAVYAAAVAAVMVLAVDWDPDEPARQRAVPRHPSARPRPAGWRIQLTDEEAFRRFAEIVHAERRAQASTEGDK